VDARLPGVDSTLLVCDEAAMEAVNYAAGRGLVV
jgi:hypothetical protein